MEVFFRRYWYFLKNLLLLIYVDFYLTKQLIQLTNDLVADNFPFLYCDRLPGSSGSYNGRGWRGWRSFCRRCWVFDWRKSFLIVVNRLLVLSVHLPFFSSFVFHLFLQFVCFFLKVVIKISWKDDVYQLFLPLNHLVFLKNDLLLTYEYFYLTKQ